MKARPPRHDRLKPLKVIQELHEVHRPAIAGWLGGTLITGLVGEFGLGFEAAQHENLGSWIAIGSVGVVNALAGIAFVKEWSTIQSETPLTKTRRKAHKAAQVLPRTGSGVRYKDLQTSCLQACPAVRKLLKEASLQPIGNATIDAIMESVRSDDDTKRLLQLGEAQSLIKNCLMGLIPDPLSTNGHSRDICSSDPMADH